MKKIGSTSTSLTSYEVWANASCKNVLAPQPGKNLHPLVDEGNPQEDKNWSLSSDNIPPKKKNPQ
jgi:hypothetical protein